MLAEGKVVRLRVGEHLRLGETVGFGQLCGRIEVS